MPPSADSPGVPPSATAHELFRGFSYVAPALNAADAAAAATNGVSAAAGAAGTADAARAAEDQDSTATVVEVSTKHSSVASRINVVSCAVAGCPNFSATYRIIHGYFHLAYVARILQGGRKGISTAETVVSGRFIKLMHLLCINCA